MHDKEAFERSKRNDNKVKEGIEKKYGNIKVILLSGNDDRRKKRDMKLERDDGKTLFIDTKYTNGTSKALSFQTRDMNGRASQADFNVYCMRKSGFKEIWWCRVSALKKLAADGRKEIAGHDGSFYVKFSVEELAASDKKKLDWSSFGLE